jgi:hypothetical protein
MFMKIKEQQEMLVRKDAQLQQDALTVRRNELTTAQIREETRRSKVDLEEAVAELQEERALLLH